MAKIKNTDIAEKDAFKNLRKSAEETNKILGAMAIVLSKNLEAQKSFSKGFKASNVQDIKNLAKAQEEVKKSTAGLNAIDKEKIRLEATLKNLNSTKIQQNEQLKVLIADQRRVNKELAKDETNLGNAFQKLTRDTNKAQNEFKRLAAQFGINSKEAKNAQVKFNELDGKLSKINASARDGRRDVGRYATAFSGLGGILKSGLGLLGITAGIAGISRLVSGAVGIFKDFEAANSKLQAILGATTEEMTLLKDQAKELGASTSFTASQVTELQTEFAKLGFPTKDIENMTESTLNAAAAMGSGLGEQAALTGATIKAFGLSSKDAARVNDVLAKSTTRSALDFSKLNASMSTIAPVASKLGFGLEDTVALLGNLSDSGFDASTAATATRNIMLNLADSSSALSKKLKEPVRDLPSLIKGLKQLTSEGVDLSEALELTDVRSVAAFSTFLSGTDSLEKLSSELKNANGAAKEMADTMLDNLSGDITIAQSAWEGFILSLEDGDGAFSRALRSVTQFATNFLGQLTRFSKSFEQNLKSDLSIQNKKFIDSFQNQIEDEIKIRQAAANEDLRLLDSRNKRGLETEKSFAESKRLIETSLENDLKKIREEAINEEIKGLEKVNKTLVDSDKQKRLSIENAENELKLLQETDAERIVSASSFGLIKNKEKESLKAISSSIVLNKSRIQVLKDLRNAEEQVVDVVEEERIALLNKQKEEERIALLNKQREEERIARLKKQREEEIKRQKEIDDLKIGKLKEKEINETGINALKDRLDREDLLRRLAAEKEADELAERLKKEAEIRQKSLEVVEALEKKFFDKRNADADKEISDAEKREARLQELADKGIQDASDSLAENQKRQVEAQKKKEDLAQQEKRTELALAVLKAFNSELEAGKDPASALASALVSSAVLVSSISALPTFFDGTEDTGNGGGLDNKGGFQAILHPNERVVPKKINSKLDGITNEQLGQAADSGLLSYALNSKQIGVKFNEDSKITKELNKLQDLNKQIISAINNKPVDKGYEVDDLRKIVTHTVQQGSRKNLIKFKL